MHALTLFGPYIGGVVGLIIVIKLLRVGLKKRQFKSHKPDQPQTPDIE
jgi:xanthine/uracil permease